MNSTNNNDEAGEHKFEAGKWAVIQSMVKQIRNGTPVYRVQLPIFLQEPRSLLERYADFCTHLDCMLRLTSYQEPELRFLDVLKFYLSGWYIRTKEIRNPFNPILGEVFNCSYEHGDSTTQYVSEQISHHPPSSAFYIFNEVKGMYMSGYIKPVFHFRGNSLDAEMQGKMIGRNVIHKEDYEITFPHIIVKGILLGALGITFSGPARVSCPQSGLYCDVDFKTKGMLRGKNNYLVAEVRHPSSKKPLYTIEGRWDQVLYITNHRTKTQQVFFDCANTPISRPTVAPLEQQAENESRKVWQHVIRNLYANNESEALGEKTKVEEQQRALDRERTAANATWTPNLFVRVSDDLYIHKAMYQLISAPRATATPLSLSKGVATPTLPAFGVPAN